MALNYIRVGDTGLNLDQLVSWEWNAERRFLVVRLVGDYQYFQGKSAQQLWLLLETLATLKMGQHTHPG